ncbi:tRNA threonylcarbamoyl adenosine modification protein YeaZ [Arboricoccus pini]|uniref:tRNA threonylcarbamoyl adenosine modification protein YeaZ n=1 Tax=Arboricoccus pini TaxID=1963835 RepID=A0A212PYH4_9PROT|nr:tRNA (adenosine(37)-N6)-threonylcarbamoyltransferase complex dimerization subunit type 1 TsaB [Arboricoccus pini]SNB52039.1 tRNA threonylcarbamoyl adenosine modification protein YeaZ [Arboricoccus pini]
MPSTEPDRPLIVAFDCTGDTLSACLGTREGVLVAATAAEDANAAEALMPLLDRMVRAHGKWSDVGLVALTIGPGGFTGVRVGVATARALSLALPCSLMPIGTLEAIAACLPPAPDLWVVKDVRRGEVVLQHFRAGRPSGGPELSSVDAARFRVLANPPSQLGGDGVALLDLGGIKIEAEGVPVAEGVWRVACRQLAEDRHPVAGTAVRPFYQRAPDAKIAQRLRPPPDVD